MLGNTPDSGLTETVDSNFYDDPDDRPAAGQRLDFVLLKPGMSTVPLVAGTDVLQFAHNGRYISDHFGIATRFDALVTGRVTSATAQGCRPNERRRPTGPASGGAGGSPPSAADRSPGGERRGASRMPG